MPDYLSLQTSRVFIWLGHWTPSHPVPGLLKECSNKGCSTWEFIFNDVKSHLKGQTYSNIFIETWLNTVPSFFPCLVTGVAFNMRLDAFILDLNVSLVNSGLLTFGLGEESRCQPSHSLSLLKQNPDHVGSDILFISVCELHQSREPSDLKKKNIQKTLPTWVSDKQPIDKLLINSENDHPASPEGVLGQPSYHYTRLIWIQSRESV